MQIDYDSVLRWLQTAASNVPAPLAPSTPPSIRNIPSSAPTPSNSGSNSSPTLSPTSQFTPNTYPSQSSSSASTPDGASSKNNTSNNNSGDYTYPFPPAVGTHIRQSLQQSQLSGSNPLGRSQHIALSQSSQSSQIHPLPQPKNSLSQSSPSQSPSQPTPSPSQPTPSPPPSTSQSPSSPSSPAAITDGTSPHPELPPLPTLNVTIYTRPSSNSAAAFSYVSNLLKHSPQGPADAGSLNNLPAHPHNISIPSCSAASLVQTLSLLRQYSSIDMNLPVHIEYTYKAIPLKVQPVGLIEISGPTLVDCNDAFGQVFGFSSARELISQDRPVSDYMLPEGIAISRRTIDLFFKLKTSRIERYQVFLLRNRPARVFLAQHELVGSRHRTITFLEEYPDFPLCFFTDWIKTILPNAILPPCSRPYCHCKYPDDYAKIG